MTINNPTKFLETIWDWGILDGCFGETRIRPTDVDGLVERNHHYLLLEAKSPGVEVSAGQMRTYENFVQDAPATVIIIWGETNRPERLRVFTKHINQEFNPANLQKLRDIVTEWYRRVDGARQETGIAKCGPKFTTTLTGFMDAFKRISMTANMTTQQTVSDDLNKIVAICDRMRGRIDDLLAEL